MSHKQLSLEYASSNRSTCKGCKLKIDKNELRIGVEQEVSDYSVTSWKHLDCFGLGPKFKDVEPQDIAGYYDLKKADKEKVLTHFEGGGKKKTAKETAKELLDSAKKEDKKKEKAKKKKGKKDESDEENEESDEEEEKKPAKKKSQLKDKKVSLGYTTAELQSFNEYVEQFEKKSIEYLKNILAANNQPKTGTKNDLVLKCADGKTKGQIPVCKACGGGKLRFDYRAGTYKCPGYMDDDAFTHCGKVFQLDEISREKWIDDLI